MRLQRAARALAFATLAYCLAEGVVSITLAARERIISLCIFGLDSLIEVASACLVLWRLCGNAPDLRRERAAVLAIGEILHVNPGGLGLDIPRSKPYFSPFLRGERAAVLAIGESPLVNLALWALLMQSCFHAEACAFKRLLFRHTCVGYHGKQGEWSTRAPLTPSRFDVPAMVTLAHDRVKGTASYCCHL